MQISELRQGTGHQVFRWSGFWGFIARMAGTAFTLSGTRAHRARTNRSNRFGLCSIALCVAILCAVFALHVVTG